MRWERLAAVSTGILSAVLTGITALYVSEMDALEIMFLSDMVGLLVMTIIIIIADMSYQRRKLLARIRRARREAQPRQGASYSAEDYYEVRV